jgi:endonuclease/exonuclease/phosphatase family metal-dependent hydrolase
VRGKRGRFPIDLGTVSVNTIRCGVHDRGRGWVGLAAATSFRFSLGSLNLHCGRDPLGNPFSVLAAVRSLETDVVALQENWRPDSTGDELGDIAARLGYFAPIELDVFPHTSLRGLGIVDDDARDETGAFGLAILSRLPMTVGEVEPLGRAGGDRGVRLAQAVTIGDDRDRAVRLVNTHLTHRLRFGPGQLRRLLAAHPARSGPTVIAGDFNMFRPTIWLARGYRSVVRGRTWPAPSPIFQIDHILANAGIRVGGREVGRPVGSDHLPLRAALGVLAQPRVRV